MTSLNLESLLTNIQMDETGENCVNDRFSNNDGIDHGIPIQCIFLHLQNQRLSDYLRDFHSNLYKRHVGHIFVMFNSHDQLKKTALYRNR